MTGSAGGDGAIRINAEMDTAGFQKESQRLGSAIASLSTKINDIGRQMSAALANGATQKQVDNLKTKLYVAAESMGELQYKLEQFSDTEVSTEPYEQVTAAIQKTEAELAKLKAREEKMKVLGITGTEEWNEYQQEITETRNRVESLTQSLENAKTRQVEIAEELKSRENGIKPMWDPEGMTKLAAESAKVGNEVAQLTVNLKDAKTEYDALVKKGTSLVNSGASAGSKQWQSLQYDIEQAKDKLEQYNAEKQRLEASGEATFFADETDSVQIMSARLDTASEKLIELNDSAQQASSGVDNVEKSSNKASGGLGKIAVSALKIVRTGLGKAFKTLSGAISTVASKAVSLAGSGLKALASGLSNVATKAGKAYTSILKVTGSTIVSGFKKLSSAAISAGKALLSLGTTNSKTSSGFNLSFKNVLRYGLGIRSLYTLFNRIRSAITSTLGDISKVDTHTNAAISSMLTAFNRLKASFGAAFQPIVTVVSPYVTRFIQLLTQMLNKTNEFIAILTGQSYYMRANVTETDYAKSLDTSTKSTKDKTDATKDNANATKKATSATNKSTKATAKENDEMERQLASFDHLNILSDNSKDNDPTGGLSSTDPSDVADTAGAIADAAGDVSDALSEMGKTTYEKVPVTGISDFLTRIREAIENQDFDGVGRVVADKINGILTKVGELVNWDNIGDKVTKIIDSVTSVFNGLVDGLDWTLLGDTVGNAVNTIVYSLDTLLEGVDWTNLGTKISEGLNSLVEKVNWGAVGDLFGDRIGSMLDLVYAAVSKFNWEMAAASLAEGLNSFIYTLSDYFDDKDFSAVGDALANSINTLMEKFDWVAAGDFLGARLNDLTDALGALIEGAKWAQVGFHLATGINSFIFKVNWDYIGTVLGKGIQGAIDAMREFVETFEWGDAGDKFADRVNALANEVSWKKLGETFGSMINIPFAYLRNAARKFEWETAGTNFSTSVNALIDTVDWVTMGESLNETLNGILDYINGFVDTVSTTDLAAGVRTMLGKIKWDELATKTWNAAKTAFQKAGSFLDTLFSESGTYNSLSSKQKNALSNTSSFLAERMDFDNRSLGEKIGDRIRNVLTKIPWAEIASNMWETAKKAMSGAVDFIAALFGVTDKDIADVGGSKIKATSKKIVLAINDAIKKIPDADVESIGTAIGDALSGITFLDAEEIGRKIGLLLNDVPWSAIAEKAVELLRLAFSGMGNILKEIFLKDIYGNEISIKDLLLGGIAVDDTNLGLDKVVKNAFNVMMDSLNSGAVIAKDKAKEVLSDIFAAGNVITGTHGEQSAQSFFEGFKSKYASASDETKSYLKPYMKLIFSDSQIEALERGDITMESFFTAMYSAASSGSDEMKLSLASMLELLYSGAGESAKPAAESAGSTSMQSVGTGMESAKAQVIDKSTGVITDALSASRNFGITEGEDVGSSTMESVGTGMQGKQAEVTQAATDMVDSAVTSAQEHSGAGGKLISEKLWSSYILETLSEQPQTIYAVGDAFDEIWESIDGDDAGSNLAKVYFESFKSKVLDENNKVKPEFVDIVTSMFGSVDSLEEGTMDAKNFMLGLVQGMQNSQGETSASLVEVIDSVLGYVQTSPQGLDSHSPSKRSEKWGEYLMAGLVQGAENEESSATKKTTSVFSNVLTSVNSTFAGALLMIQKNIPGFTNAVESSFSGSLSKWNDVFKTGMTNINSTTSTSLTTMQSTILTALSNLEKHFPTRFATYKTQFTTGWNNIKNTTSTTMNQISTNVQSALSRVQSTFSSQLSSIGSTVSSRMNSIGNSVSNGLQSAMNRANGINWYGVGINIVQGIYNGINGWWGWLNNTVWNLAISLYNTARNALGIHSPSRLFRDGVGKMMGLGVAEGVEDSQPSIMDKVTNVTDAIMEEMNATDATANLGIHGENLLAGLDDVLTTFSGRIGDSFTSLIERLNAITNSVAFGTPLVASGGLLPYSVSGNPANGYSGLYGAQSGSDDLASVIIQSTNQAALAIVRAIERASESKSLTKSEMTGIVVDEINRQTRAMGQSPLLI